MEEHLTQVRTYKRTENEQNELSKLSSKKLKTLNSITTAKEALHILQNEPNYQDLVFILNYISQQDSDINIYSPSPLSAQLVHILVSQIVPSFWNILSGLDNQCGSKSTTDSRLLISCLQNVASLNSIILHIKIYIQSSNISNNATAQSPSVPEYLKIYLDLLGTLLNGNDLIERIWKNYFGNLKNSLELTRLWKEILMIFGSGVITGTCAEAEDLLHSLNKNYDHKYWFTNGRHYSCWFSRSIVCWVKKSLIPSDVDLKCCAELLGKALSLGYPDIVVQEIVTGLLLDDNYSSHFSKLCVNLSSSDQRKLIYSLLKLCSTKFLSSDSATDIANGISQWWKRDVIPVSAVAALISSIITGNEIMKNHLLTWLSGNFGAGVGEGVSIRRSVIAAIANDNHCIESILEKCIEQFGDHLYIQHTPTLQQEVHCQVLLLTAGYIHRESPLRLRMIVKSGSSLSLVSNRLASSSNRARFLGMVVGEVISALVDKDENKMDFKTGETSSSEAKWYKSLTKVVDSVGTLKNLKLKGVTKNLKHLAISDHKKTAEPSSVKSKDLENKLVANVKMERKDLESDGLDIYTKPDSDPEDSDDDPTLINRNKLIMPVYIRDLISYLRNNESFDHQTLGLSTAASLIRRKANFGTEVSDHAEELATLLVGIQDKYEIENFSSLRLAGMVAILVAVPSKMGKWFSNTFFEGDYSISQRSSILTVLSLGAREIGGLGIEKDINLSNQSIESLFPSKTLPLSLEKYYSLQASTQVDALSAQLERNMISPMAASLADKLTGPTILKIRTFSSRLEVEKKRPKPSINKLSKIVGESFLFPLTGRFFIHSHSYTISKRSVIFQPFLLSHFIKTLALILHAAGPSTPSLSQMTAEFWDILLGLRVSTINERIVYEAICFAILTILELNLDRSELAQAQGCRLLETQNWVVDIINGIGEGDEDERCKILAVGCMVRIQEIVEKYQKILLGSM
ncbi:DNA replication checkpoint protein tel2 [Erysiphe neolycopersici]|uniref:DNA replication checkpoint protein tel2 n=1 Tax=Erysiphe neolycopersici TaxID=212602 RepID=A0A420HY42_9PEZI|nr:DNA replication checkpoint protein tel2 [Erysiphe neolycopersici]